MKEKQALPGFRKGFLIYLFPPLLIVAMYFAFRFFTDIWGSKDGFMAGMLFYWLFCCLVPVMLWVSKGNRRLLLKIKRPAPWELLLLVIPVSLAVVYAVFHAGQSSSLLPFVLLALAFSFTGAVSEELFWRGLYYDHHQGNFFHAVIVPSIWFGIWQYVPLSVQPSGIGNIYFILAAVVMGFCWGIVTFYTRSVFWAVISHLLTGLLGGFYYFE